MAAFSFASGLECVSCRRRYDLDDGVNTCPDCGPLTGTLDVLYNLDGIRDLSLPRLLEGRREASLWRYHELLPIRDPAAPLPLPAGMTPLSPPFRALGGGLPERLWLKDDTRLPSGSTKDRASAVGVARASSPTGPFTKASGPILVTGGAWVGPGHCSVVDTPAGDTAMVYAAWKEGCVNTSGCGRLDLVDEILWQNGWPAVPLAPSSTSRPLL